MCGVYAVYMPNVCSMVEICVRHTCKLHISCACVQHTWGRYQLFCMQYTCKIYMCSMYAIYMPNMCSKVTGMYAVYMPNMCSKVTGMYAACIHCFKYTEAKKG